MFPLWFPGFISCHTSCFLLRFVFNIYVFNSSSIYFTVRNAIRIHSCSEFQRDSEPVAPRPHHLLNVTFLHLYLTPGFHMYVFLFLNSLFHYIALSSQALVSGCVDGQLHISVSDRGSPWSSFFIKILCVLPY